MAGDRLEIIQGVGPAIARKLYQAGVDSFLALSLLTAGRLKELVGPRTAKMLDAESVICQAKKLASERHAR
jgi:predicted flap endonuclease-1-like 5' DNA nuclease